MSIISKLFKSDFNDFENLYHNLNAFKFDVEKTIGEDYLIKNILKLPENKEESELLEFYRQNKENINSSEFLDGLSKIIGGPDNSRRKGQNKNIFKENDESKMFTISYHKRLTGDLEFALKKNKNASILDQVVSKLLLINSIQPYKKNNIEISIIYSRMLIQEFVEEYTKIINSEEKKFDIITSEFDEKELMNYEDFVFETLIDCDNEAFDKFSTFFIADTGKHIKSKNTNLKTRKRTI